MAGGRVRALAVASAKRSKFGPAWPTLQEEGVADVNASTWTALLAPKETPEQVIAQLNAEVTYDLPNHVTIIAPEYSPSCLCVKKKSKWKLFGK